MQYLFLALRKSLGQIKIDSHAISFIYDTYKKELFPKLLQNPNVQPEDNTLVGDVAKGLPKVLVYLR